MKNKKGFVLSILFVFFICGVTIPLFMTNHRKVKADTITDLTGTTWLLNDEITWINNGGHSVDVHITFTSNNYSYNELVFENVDEDYDDCYLGYLNTSPYRYDTCYYASGQYGYTNLNITDTDYQQIEITGGSDVTDSSFISWLQNNATQQIPIPSGTEITNQYWAPSGVFYLDNNVIYSDDSIEYFILFNQYDSNLEDTEQTGLYFEGYNTIDLHSYIRSNSSYIYIGNSNSITNIMLLEFNVGDYIDTDLYNFMTLIGYWFDEYEPYNLGIYQGYIEGHRIGLAEGQADGVQYTNLVSGIFNGIGDLLSIQVFPNITIGLLIGLPLLLGVLIIIIKILRG